MKKLIALCFMAISAAACSHPSTNQDKPSEEMTHQTQMQQTGIWIDVRSADEYTEGHLKDALNIPYDNIANQISQVTTDKNAQINLYCRSGRRAEIAKQSLLELGYTNVINHGAYQDLLNQEK